MPLQGNVCAIHINILLCFLSLHLLVCGEYIVECQLAYRAEFAKCFHVELALFTQDKVFHWFSFYVVLLEVHDVLQCYLGYFFEVKAVDVLVNAHFLRVEILCYDTILCGARRGDGLHNAVLCGGEQCLRLR